MLPFQRKKVDISVRNSDFVMFLDTECSNRSETESAGAAALCEVWKVAYTQEYADEDAKSWDNQHFRAVS